MIAGLTKRGVGGDRSPHADCGAASTTTTPPALYFVDSDGIIHHVGERRYEQSERAVQRLLSLEPQLVGVNGLGALIGVLGFPP